MFEECARTPPHAAMKNAGTSEPHPKSPLHEPTVTHSEGNRGTKEGDQNFQGERAETQRRERLIQQNHRNGGFPLMLPRKGELDRMNEYPGKLRRTSGTRLDWP